MCDLLLWMRVAGQFRAAVQLRPHLIHLRARDDRATPDSRTNLDPRILVPLRANIRAHRTRSNSASDRLLARNSGAHYRDEDRAAKNHSTLLDSRCTVRRDERDSAKKHSVRFA